MIDERKEPNEHSAGRTARLPGTRGIRKGIVYFLILTIAGLALVFFYTNTRRTTEVLGCLNARFFAIAIVLAFLDMWFGAWRYHIFVRKMKPGTTPWLCFRANLANMFMGAVTPSQSGGGPAQVYILYRGGVPLPVGIALSVITFMATLTFFLLAAALSLVVVHKQFSHEAIRYLVRYGFVAFAGFLAFFVFALWRPELLGRLVGGLAGGIAAIRRKWSDRIHNLNRRFEAELHKYHVTCTHILRKDPLLLLATFGLTILLYSNKFTLAYFIMRGLGTNTDYLSMYAIQTLILFILYFSPSPGGSGIAELSIAALMATLMPTYQLPVYTLLYRFFLLYLPVVLGSLVVLAELRSQAKSSSLA